MDERGLVETIASETWTPSNIVVERIVAFEKEEIYRRIAQAIDRQWIRPMERKDFREVPTLVERRVMKGGAAEGIALVDGCLADRQQHAQTPLVVFENGGMKQVINGAREDIGGRTGSGHTLQLRDVEFSAATQVGATTGHGCSSARAAAHVGA
jgi:hypothetical protein